MGVHPFHSFVRRTRPHPDLPGIEQVTLVCCRCEMVLYEWEHRDAPRVLTDEATRGWLAECPGEPGPTRPKIFSSPVSTG